MKTYLLLGVIALLVSESVEAKKFMHKGVPKSEMQPQHQHREPWPVGRVDDGGDDADVLEQFNKPEPKRKQPEEPPLKFPWEYDQDVLHTGKSIQQAEDMTGNKLTHESVKVHRGIDMISDYKGANYYRRPLKMDPIPETKEAAPKPAAPAKTKK